MAARAGRFRANYQLNRRIGRAAAAVAARTGVRGGSRTATLTRTKLTELVRPDGPISESSVFVSLPGPSFDIEPGIMKLLAPQTYNSAVSQRTIWNSGRQAYDNVGSFWSTANSDLTNMITEAATLANTANVNNYRIYCKSLTAKIMCTNQTNDVAHLTIYDCYAKRDITNANYLQPAIAVSTGSGDQNQITYPTALGTQPFAISAFNELYKCVKITDVMMHSGGHHVHTVRSSPKKVFNKALLNESSIITPMHLAHFTMIVVHGFPLNDNAQTNITTGSGAIDFAVSKQYTYCLALPTSSQPTFGTALSSAPAQQNIVNDLTGAATTITIV